MQEQIFEGGSGLNLCVESFGDAGNTLAVNISVTLVMANNSGELSWIPGFHLLGKLPPLSP